MTPPHGDPPRDGDADRWLPDPSWPVPPRGWQLWAAAGAASGPVGLTSADRGGPAGATEGQSLEGLESHRSHRSHVHTEASMHHTDDVLSEMPRLSALEDASFTLPTRPTALVGEAWFEQERVDLLADRRARLTAPEETVRGFVVLAALLLVSCLAGGVTGGLIVLGVSTLLAASAALVQGHLSLTRVGGQRGAGVLLGAAVVALITGSVAAHDRPSGVSDIAALVPVSSHGTAGPLDVSQNQTAYAATPPSSAAVRPAPAVTSLTSPVTSPSAGAGAEGTDESVASLTGEATPAPTAATRATPATPATPPAPGTSGRAATPATPAVPAEPGADVSATVSGLRQVRAALTLSPDALSPRPAPVAPKPKAPKASRIGTAVSTSASARPAKPGAPAKTPTSAKASVLARR